MKSAVSGSNGVSGRQIKESPSSWQDFLAARRGLGQCAGAQPSGPAARLTNSTKSPRTVISGNENKIQ
jgi:hypothetical protein